LELYSGLVVYAPQIDVYPLVEGESGVFSAKGATHTSLVSSFLKRKDGLRFGGEAVTSRGRREPEPVA
jgi:hypothetical protein